MAVDDVDPEDDLPLDPPEGDDQEADEQDQPETDEQEGDAEEGEDDPQPDQAARQQTGDQRQPSRGERRHQVLSNELRERDRRIEELNRRLDTVLAGTQRPQGETSEQRAQRLALLTPEERITETLRESEGRHAREIHELRFATLDGNDRAAFEAKATVDPLYAKWKPRVETELAALRKQGQNVDREKLMYYLLGKNAVEARTAQGKQQRRAGQARINAQRTRPSNSGSDTAATRRDRNTSLERRLENQSI